MKRSFTTFLTVGFACMVLFTSCGGGGGGSGDDASDGQDERESSTIDWLPNGSSLSIRLDAISEKTVNGAAVANPDFTGMYRQILLNVGANATGNLYLDGMPVPCRLDFWQDGNAFVCEIMATSPSLMVTLTQGVIADSNAHAGHWVYQYQDSLNGQRIIARGSSATLTKENN